MITAIPKEDGEKQSSNIELVKVTLIDFNVSRRFREKSTAEKISSGEFDSPAMKRVLMLTNTGAASFTSPEINSGQSYTEKIDLWGVGCVLYHTIFNNVPFPQ